MTVDPKTLAYRYPGGNGPRLNAAAIVHWYQQAGVKTQSKKIKKEAAAVARYVGQLQRRQTGGASLSSGAFGGTGSTGWVDQWPVTWYLCTVLAGVVAVYVMGYLLYLKVYRARQRAWRATVNDRQMSDMPPQTAQ